MLRLTPLVTSGGEQARKNTVIIGSSQLVRTMNVQKFLLLIWMLSVSVAVCAQSEDYRFAPGDTVAIAVFDEPDLTLRLRISERGFIEYPFLGSTYVAGETTDGIEQILIDGLKGPYLIDPKIQVSVAEYRDVYVSGEVRNPGGYPFTPGLTIRQAISLAGGLTERASERKVYVLAEGSPESERKNVEMGYILRPGDTVSIEQSFF